MTEPSLKCNFPKCKVQISTDACVTRCSHIFCKTHRIQGNGLDRRCPACGAILEGSYDVYMLNINPSEEEKSTILTGYSPDMIFEVISKGLQFWAFQIQMQTMYQKSGFDHLCRRLAKKESDFEKMQLEIKHFVQTQQQKIEHLQNEVDTLTNTVKGLEGQITEKNRQLFNLQSRYEGLRRQSVASIITRDEPMDSEPINYNDRRVFINRDPAPPTPSFVFCPYTPRRTPVSSTTNSTPRPRPPVNSGNLSQRLF